MKDIIETLLVTPYNNSNWETKNNTTRQSGDDNSNVICNKTVCLACSLLMYRQVMFMVCSANAQNMGIY